nr:rust resistance kinase lr10 [Quercus suber]
MDISLRIVIPTLLLFVLFIVDLGEGHNWCPIRCGDHGPDIRPPFRLSKDRQPDQHGGFDLYCNDKDDTVLELSTSVKAFVKNIDYKSQSIEVTDSDGCFPRKIRDLKLNLSSSPFRFNVAEYNFSLFDCMPETVSGYSYIDCLSSSRHQVYAFLSERDIDDLPILSCTKMYSVSSVPYYIWYNPLLELTWSGSECGRGEVKGKNCRFEENSTDSKTECKDKGALTKIVIIGSILGSFLLVLVVYALYRVYRYDKTEKENQARIEMFLEDYKALKPTRKNVDIAIENTSQIYFPEWIYNLLEQKEDLRVYVEDNGDAKIAKKLAIVGLWCIQWHPVDRPSMKVVVQMLEGEGDKLTMPPNPFASTGPTRINVSMPARRLNQELEVILESE